VPELEVLLAEAARARQLAAEAMRVATSSGGAAPSSAFDASSQGAGPTTSKEPAPGAASIEVRA
jgi:hypothetical protein